MECVLYFCWARTGPIVVSLASHMSSKGSSQFVSIKIGVSINIFFNSFKTLEKFH